jgi:hypothetical protein
VRLLAVLRGVLVRASARGRKPPDRVVSAVLLAASLGGVAGGAALIGTWALGLAVITDSAVVGAWALFHDDGAGRAPSAHEVPTLEQILARERARRAG